MTEIVDLESGRILVGGAGPEHAVPQHLLLRHANRHGLIAGATGTGKTVTLQTLAEAFSTAGVAVFLADVKGDLAGLARPGRPDSAHDAAFRERAARFGMSLDYRGFPVAFWDVFGERGHPLRTTPAEMGPLLLARLLGLTPVQEGVLHIAFRVADEQGLALLDLADLRQMLIWVGEHARELSLRHGNVSSASVGAIQRALMVLESEGAAQLFGEPALELGDLIRRDPDGRGVINILTAERLMNAPRLYASFLLWLLSELFEQLPELGDADRPRIAFFFDEAHLLFDDAPEALVDKIEQVARLIRSRGVSLWFVTQNPADLPEAVLGQLGNRIQHALRAFTARDQQALRLAARNYRPNPDFDTAEAIRDVATGEAVTSLLDEKGVPGMVQRTLIRPPLSRLGPIAEAERAAIIAASPMGLKYARRIERESAAERLAARAEAEAQATAEAAAAGKAARAGAPEAERADPPRRGGRSDTMMVAFGKSLARQLGTQAGRAFFRGVLGTLSRRR